MILTMGVSLYTTRLVLNALGSTDFGIFQLVAGIIVMLSFLNNAMATTTQRFLSFNQGRKDISVQKEIFSNSLVLHVIIGIGLVVILETLGLFLFDGFLNIPTDRIDQAQGIYHFMAATVFFTVISVPFTGSLIAHENMLWVALVNIVEVLLKLGIAASLFIVKGDKLFIFGLLMAGISIFSLILYAGYCFRKYPECKIDGTFQINKAQIKDLSSFASWNLFGALCGLGRTQGLAILLNLFLGTVVNAAYGIAIQVSNQMNVLSSTLLRAINPQIMKSEGANDRQRMLRLSMMASKFGFFLISIIAIPFIFEMKSILIFWLKNVPEYAVIFCSLILVSTMINQLTIGLQSAIQATGKIKVYQAIVGGTLLLNLPIAYLLLSKGFPAYSVIISYAFIEAIACGLRLHFLKKQAGLSISSYFDRVFLRELFPLLLSIGICYGISNYINLPYRFLLTISSSAILYLLAIYIFGLCNDEKKIINKIFSSTTKKWNSPSLGAKYFK